MAAVKQAGAVALRESDGVIEALIVRAKKDPSKWIFPKGHIEPGETAADAARRELAEEAGVRGSIVQPVGTLSFQSGDEYVEVTYYLARFAGTAPKEDDRECAWLPIADAKRTLSFDNYRPLLDAAVRAFTAE
jgi:8-oxo-dGTP pyrophosphatase MutT (NUDIX family)